VPWVSASWEGTFKWKGEGPITDDDLTKLKSLVEKAHAQKRLIRFWAAPDNEMAWKTLRDAGVDLLNTDDLAGLAKFLNQ
jgi:glycerophosphoryl diester phosphodiesterase